MKHARLSADRALSQILPNLEGLGSTTKIFLCFCTDMENFPENFDTHEELGQY